MAGVLHWCIWFWRYDGCCLYEECGFVLLVYASRWKKWHVSGLFWDICVNYNGWLSCNLLLLMGNVMGCG